MIFVFDWILLLIIYTMAFGYWLPTFRKSTAVYIVALLDPQDGKHEAYTHPCLPFDKALHYISREVRGKTNKMQQLDVYYQHFLNMFRTSLCPFSGDQDVCYCTWCAAL